MYYYYQAIINNNSLVYYKIRNEAKAAYNQNTIKSLKTYNIIKSDAVHKCII